MNTQCTLKTLDNYTIAAIHTISNRERLILWLHGLGMDKDEYLGFFRQGAEYLANKGFDSLRIDFRGHGKSSGTLLDFSIAGQMLDVECAIKFILEAYSPKKIPLYIVGCSFSASPAIFTALNHPDLVSGIVLVSPVLSYKRTFLDSIDFWRPMFNPRLIEEMKIIRPDSALREVKQHVAIIHGDSDSMVPYAITKEISNQIEGVRLYSIPEVGHGFTDINDKTSMSKKSQDNKIRIFDIISENCEF
jgi:hypothetical protein